MLMPMATQRNVMCSQVFVFPLVPRCSFPAVNSVLPELDSKRFIYPVQVREIRFLCSKYSFSREVSRLLCSNVDFSNIEEKGDSDKDDSLNKEGEKSSAKSSDRSAKSNVNLLPDDPPPWSTLFLIGGLIFAAIHFFLWKPPSWKLMQADKLQAAKPGTVVYIGKVPFSVFLKEVDRKNVKKVEIDGQTIKFVLNKVEKDNTIFGPNMVGYEGLELVTLRPKDLPTPYKLLIDKGVEFGAPDRQVLKVINSISVGLLYAGILVVLITRLPIKFAQNSTGVMSKRGSSKDSLSGKIVTFADVAGVDEAKEELMEIVDYLRDPQKFIRVGARPPRGILLVGPPGTGKTLLARAVAGEASVPFISCSASEFVELYVGMGAYRVRELFTRARQVAPSIVFIDEIDAVAKSRDGKVRSNGNDEREQTLNQLLTELDGFSGHSSVIVLAATNRADVLDSALKRPGRFDRIVEVEAPDKAGREAILKVHVSNKTVPLASDVSIPAISVATAGFTGAELANLVNEAALLAARTGKLEVTQEEFEMAVERSRGGLEKKKSSGLGSIEKSVVSRHEIGHAILGTAVAMVLEGQPAVEKISIVPRTGGALGFTYMPPLGEERRLLFVDELKARLLTLLGGRAAEEVFLGGRVTSGAVDDIRRATDIAYRGVAELGLSRRVGPLSMATLRDRGADGGLAIGGDQGELTELVQREVYDLIHSSLEMAVQVVLENRNILDGLGAVLEMEEKLQGAVLADWLCKVKISPEFHQFLVAEQLPLRGVLPAAHMLKASPRPATLLEALNPEA